MAYNYHTLGPHITGVLEHQVPEQHPTPSRPVKNNMTRQLPNALPGSTMAQMGGRLHETTLGR